MVEVYDLAHDRFKVSNITTRAHALRTQGADRRLIRVGHPPRGDRAPNIGSLPFRPGRCESKRSNCAIAEGFSGVTPWRTAQQSAITAWAFLPRTTPRGIVLLLPRCLIPRLAWRGRDYRIASSRSITQLLRRRHSLHPLPPAAFPILLEADRQEFVPPPRLFLFAATARLARLEKHHRIEPGAWRIPNAVGVFKSSNKVNSPLTLIRPRAPPAAALAAFQKI